MLRKAFGHRAEVTEDIEARIERGDYHRASGQCLCEICNREYWRHCALQDPYEFLTLLCTGIIVKL